MVAVKLKFNLLVHISYEVQQLEAFLARGLITLN